MLFEHHGTDADGVDYWIYTVGGYLDGARLADGCTVSGEVILVNADTRGEADFLASMGLADTITALDGEAAAYIDAQAALARMQSVGAVEVLSQAMKPASDKSDAFMADAEKIDRLKGDDIVLAAGRVAT